MISSITATLGTEREPQLWSLMRAVCPAGQECGGIGWCVSRPSKPTCALLVHTHTMRRCRAALDRPLTLELRAGTAATAGS